MEREQHDVRMAVHKVIEEINAAYCALADQDYMNADYADFAVMALDQFQLALGRPDLTREELEVMLRNGLVSHKSQGENTSWTKFMAIHMERASNGNETIIATPNIIQARG